MWPSVVTAQKTWRAFCVWYNRMFEFTELHTSFPALFIFQDQWGDWLSRPRLWNHVNCVGRDAVNLNSLTQLRPPDDLRSNHFAASRLQHYSHFTQHMTGKIWIRHSFEMLQSANRPTIITDLSDYCNCSFPGSRNMRRPWCIVTCFMNIYLKKKQQRTQWVSTVTLKHGQSPRWAGGDSCHSAQCLQ